MNSGIHEAGFHLLGAGILLPILIAIGCDSPARTGASAPPQAVEPSFTADPLGEHLLIPGRVISTGPNGETPTPADQVDLTERELAQIRQMHARAAIALHYGGNDWSTAQVNGLKTQFEKMGVTVISVTDAGFKPEKQVSDLETVLAKKPEIIVSAPTDTVATAGAYKNVANHGVKLVLMGNVPRGLIAGKDYVSAVAADNYENGVVSGRLMGAALGGRGGIGIIYHASDFFVTQERYKAFKRTIRQEFPNITVVVEQGIGGPDFAGDAEKAASAILTSHRNIDGIWAVWDVPAEGVIAAARTAGRKKLVLTTCDLGRIVALDMARGGFVKGVGGQRPFDQGTAEAMLAGYALIGKKAPTYVSVPVLPVTRENLLEAWRTVYHEEAPADVRQAQSGSSAAPGRDTQRQ